MSIDCLPAVCVFEFAFEVIGEESPALFDACVMRIIWSTTSIKALFNSSAERNVTSSNGIYQNYAGSVSASNCADLLFATAKPQDELVVCASGNGQFEVIRVFGTPGSCLSSASLSSASTSTEGSSPLTKSRIG